MTFNCLFAQRLSGGLTVGHHWPLRFRLVCNGDGVTLTPAKGRPNPFGEGPGILTGTRNGDAISGLPKPREPGRHGIPGDAVNRGLDKLIKPVISAATVCSRRPH
jgi:hypothetical protein